LVVNWSAPNKLWVNNGDGTFTSNPESPISELSRTSSDCAWGDYNGDNYLDIFITNRDHANELYINNTDGSFTRIDTGAIVTDNHSSISCSWIDYDVDGDLDVYVANTYDQNNRLYENKGNGSFLRVDTLSITMDGQHASGAGWGDYDNDGDLDLFVPHANHGDNNYLYRNDGSGEYILIKNTPLTKDGGISAGSAWGDIDNDGDLDLVVANGGWLQAEKNFFYLNQGNGEFERVENDTSVRIYGQSDAITLVDWDKDGMLEMMTANKGQRNYCFENNLENNWFLIKCIGTNSNRSAIGTRVHLKSTINGNPIWQLRLVSGHNGRRSHPGFDLHFGLGDADMIDSLVVRWPSGLNETYTDIGVNQEIQVIENQGIVNIHSSKSNGQIPDDFFLYQNYPNPFNPVTTISYRLPTTSFVNLEIYNILGQKVSTLVSEKQAQGFYKFIWNASGFASGVYIYRLITNKGFVQARKLIILK
jgi:hypothetical protein